MIPEADILIRMLILVISTETAVRYALWYARVIRMRPPEPLRELMAGICVAHVGTAISIAHSIGQIVVFHANFWSTPTQEIAGLGYIVGTMCCLIPCWRISCNASDRWIVGNIAIRIGLAYAIAVIVVGLHR